MQMLGPLKDLPELLITELWPLFLLFVVLGMEFIAPSMLGKYSATVIPQYLSTFYFATICSFTSLFILI